MSDLERRLAEVLPEKIAHHPGDESIEPHYFWRETCVSVTFEGHLAWVTFGAILEHVRTLPEEQREDFGERLCLALGMHLEYGELSDQPQMHEQTAETVAEVLVEVLREPS